MQIREFQPSDLETLLAINQAGVPGVGSETAESLATWIGLSRAFIAEIDGAPAGFLTLIERGEMRYPSNNLRWLENWGPDFIYVDRIAIAASAQGMGVGSALYRNAFEAFAGSTPWMTCEVNLRPLNAGSLRFHERLGFAEIGRRSFDENCREVVYLARPLA